MVNEGNTGVVGQADRLSMASVKICVATKIAFEQ